MKWLSSKQGVLAAVLSLLLVVLLAALTTKNESLAESELNDLVLAVKPLYEFRRKIGASGFEYEYRTGHSWVPGYERRRMVGMVYLMGGGSRRALNAFALPNDPRIRKFGPPTKQYSKNIGVAGWIQFLFAQGLVPLVEMKKFNKDQGRADFIYVQPGTTQHTARSQSGYRFTRRVGFMKPPMTNLPIYRWVRDSRGLGGYTHQYRASSEPVPDFSKRDRIGFLLNNHAPGRVALKIFSTKSNSRIRRFSLATGGSHYPRYMGLAGWCDAKKRRNNQVPLYGMRKYFAKLNRHEFVYVTNQKDLDSLKKQGFTSPVRLCYIKRP